ncbi:RidA family protein [Mycolicibacterium fallax]|uniref:hypothetical protein n=1 Tax=Mycolicibacterium fallax TaxID=1793 RepID=UPI001FD0D8ED|nr:hypothetical protein [Mycolicibacterium fallax]
MTGPRIIVPAWMRSMHDEHHFAPGILDGDLLRCSGMLGLRPDLSLPADPACPLTPRRSSPRPSKTCADCSSWRR